MERNEKMTERNPAELKRMEKETNRRLLSLEVVIGWISAVSFVALLFAAIHGDMRLWARILFICIGAAVFAVGMYQCLRIEHDAGYYECRNCGKRYVPEMKSIVLAMHIGRSRRLKCPYCGKTSFHKKTLTK